MVPALFVANYIIEYSNAKSYVINNLKLQKILYFVNARNIVENGSPLFEEEMETFLYAPFVLFYNSHLFNSHYFYLICFFLKPR